MEFSFGANTASTSAQGERHPVMGVLRQQNAEALIAMFGEGRMTASDISQMLYTCLVHPTSFGIKVNSNTCPADGDVHGYAGSPLVDLCDSSCTIDSGHILPHLVDASQPLPNIAPYIWALKNDPVLGARLGMAAMGVLQIEVDLCSVVPVTLLH